VTGYLRRVLRRVLGGLSLLMLVSCSEDPAVERSLRDAGADVSNGLRDAASDGAGDAADAAADRLSQSGLYEDVAAQRLAPGVVAYEPLYELWSDGAEKRRWLYLPPGERIDTSNMDYWVYPQGTKIWKEFVRDGVRVETRLLHKRGRDSSSWFMMAYQWNAEQTDALALPRGASNVSGTQHDVPSQTDCATCHDAMPDRVLGVTAIQLSHSLPGVTLQSLASEGRLTTAPSSYVVPGNATERRALGYLHANCGNCHNPTAPVYSRVCLDLWLSTAALSSVQATSIYASSHGVQVSSQSAPAGVDCRLSGRSIANSALYTRMNTRGAESQMPPLGSERVDDQGLGILAAWIGQMAAAPTCDADCGDRGDGGPP
jgi:hypothetical protein